MPAWPAEPGDSLGPVANVGSSAWPQRGIALLVLLVAGIVSLRLAAALFDGQGSENWILLVQLAGMALIGVVIFFLLLSASRAPRPAGADTTLVPTSNPSAR